MDGLLLDTEKIYYESALACSERKGYGVSEDLILSSMGLNMAATRELFMTKMGPDFPFDRFFEDVEVLHKEYLQTKGIQKKKGVDELFVYLDEKGIRKSVATSTYKDRADMFMELAGISGLFDHIVYGNDLKESKPHPHIYLKAIKAFDFDKDEILAFEDSNNGILSAYNAGLKVVHIPDLAKISKEAKEKSFIILEDLSQAIKLIEQLNS